MIRLGVCVKERLALLFRSAIRLSLLTLLVFLLLNVIAAIAFNSVRTRSTSSNSRPYFIAPGSPEGEQILTNLLPSQDGQAALKLTTSDPGIRPHPVLGFTEGLSTTGYQIGIESIRYQTGWTDGTVQQWLQEHPTFVLGGSTAFGHGVEADRTVAAELNRLRPVENHLNLAIQASDSIREVDRLVHLLRLGYRPARVIFIDGLNDISTFSWSPYRALDKPRTQTLLLDRGETSLILGHPRSNNMVRAFRFSLPVVQLLHHWQWQTRFKDITVTEKRADLEPLDWQELMFFYTRWSEFQPERSNELAEEWIDYYRANLEFVEALGWEFGFQPLLIFQPVGLADPANPFIKPAYLESPVFHLYSSFVTRVQEAIQSGGLPVGDCSSAFTGASARSFVDIAHYSPAGNRRLAECIQEKIEEREGR